MNGVPAVPLQTFSQAAQTSIATPQGNAVLEEAYAIFNGFTCTHYQHIYEVNHTYVYADCVGWTGNLTRLATPVAWRALVSRTNLRSGMVPSPARFLGFFNALAKRPTPGWQTVGSIGQIRAGDVLAWTPESMNADTSGTGLAGHSVLAVSDPVPVAGRSDAYYLVVMDSTATAHGPQDSRAMTAGGTPVYPWADRNAPLGWSALPGKAKGSALSGLGIGTIEIVAGATPSKAGIYWSPPTDQGKTPEHVAFGAGRPVS
jgi:hypothetical protein